MDLSVTLCQLLHLFNCSCLLTYTILWQKTWWLLNKNWSLILSPTRSLGTCSRILKMRPAVLWAWQGASNALVWAQDFPLLWWVVSGAGKNCLGPTPRFLFLWWGKQWNYLEKAKWCPLPWKLMWEGTKTWSRGNLPIYTPGRALSPRLRSGSSTSSCSPQTCSTLYK